jgi:hypothetical protein
MGSGHLLNNKSRAKKILSEEWKTLNKVLKGEPLLEMIDPLGIVLRVNLRVYKKIGGDLNRIFNVFLNSAKEIKENKMRLIKYWENILNLNNLLKQPFSTVKLNDFWNEVQNNDLPLIHHSEAYVDANQPSYRIIHIKYRDFFTSI